jgi:hypothetical protein
MVVTINYTICSKLQEIQSHAQIRSHGYAPLYVGTWSCDCAGQMTVILRKQVSLAYMVKVYRLSN